MIRALAALPFSPGFWVVALAAVSAAAQPQAPFRLEEATIATVHGAFRDGRLTCVSLVQQYLARIAAYDKNGPALNAIVTVNPEAEREARALDERFAQSGLTGSLHCVPLIVKDNFETRGLASTNGALVLRDYVPAQDAFQVRRLREAGAIVLAKSSMAEWAFSPYETVNSVLPGYTRNPYSPDRVTAGSSGGTAAAVAANFGLAGLGTDTGNSIRGPSSHQALVGIRSTMGLTSRAGVFPLNLLADIAGPMTRTVEDAARLLQVIAGTDVDDPVTAAADGRLHADYLSALDRDGLRGVRIGVLRQAYERETTDGEITAVFGVALDDMRRSGAVIVDPATVEGLEDIRRPESGPGSRSDPCMGFKYDLNRFLRARTDRVSVKSLAEVIASGGFHPHVQRRLETAEAGPENGPESAACRVEQEYRDKVRKAVLATMDRLQLDAFAYPTWSNPPRLIGDLNTPHGDNSQFFSPTTGFPAVNVPMGYTRGDRLPVGITIYGRAWSEPLLLKLAYAYEQATRHRRAPASVPPLQ